ncbi:required for meiotic nuclear division protein 1 [Chaetomidium leptoderma]|uniref:Required for meiotic nuclear division protein 1 n=1 Tax=Chaetomidium leptoderma TaxID=669021 RepID=A0AAN6ZWC9_9PEZI|nr:required for meiotic nuclear division protein 1 [Chaetomidium leptoderma]
MRSLLPHIGSASRSASASVFSLTHRPFLSQRHFHPTPTPGLPRRRNFFTSNVLLQQDGSEPPRTPAAGNKAANDRPSSSPTQSVQKKRKPPLKNSLHRVAIVAQKGVPGKPPSSAAEPHTGEDGSSTISAVCVAESFDMDGVEDILKNHGFSLDPDGTGFESHEVVHARGFNNGDIFVFPSGTVVTWALPPDVVNTLATKHLLPAAEMPFIEDKEEEDLDFLVDPEQEQSRVSGDAVVLGTRREVEAGDRLDTTLAKIAFSSGLARSTKLAVLESSLTRYLESTRHIPDRLSQGLRAPLSRGMILQKAGELLNLRSQLNHYNDLTDALPDIFWDTEEKLETYYAKIGKALDVGVRIKTLNDKMTYAQEVVTVAQGVLDISEKMSSEKHSTRLEWIIIILIAIEVAFELRRLYMERYDVFQDELLAELRGLRVEMRKGERADAAAAAK